MEASIAHIWPMPLPERVNLLPDVVNVIKDTPSSAHASQCAG